MAIMQMESTNYTTQYPENYDLEKAWEIVRSGIIDWYYQTRSFSSIDALNISLRTNTELVPKRGDLILTAIEKYTTLDRKPGMRILDVGSGFGTIGMYIFQQLQASEMTAIDSDSICIDTCKKVVEHLDINGIQYNLDDMISFKTPTGSYNLVLSNNSFCFIQDADKIRQAIRNFYQALEPGGSVVIYAPNKWHLKEAFTKLYGIQFLPRGLADRYARFRGYPEPYTVRLLSPLELYTWFGQAGFQKTQLINPYRGTSGRGWARFFKPYYLFIATK